MVLFLKRGDRSLVAPGGESGALEAGFGINSANGQSTGNEIISINDEAVQISNTLREHIAPDAVVAVCQDVVCVLRPNRAD